MQLHIESRLNNAIYRCELRFSGLKQVLQQDKINARIFIMDKLHEALISIRRILRASDIHAKKLGKITGLKTSQLLVLQSLEEFGEMTVGQIAAKVNLAQASTTSLVDKLQAMGFVSRERGDTDKRKVFVRLTEQGRSILDRAPMALHDRFSDNFNSLEEWEQTFLIAALQRVSGMMDASDIDVAPVLDHDVIVEKRD